MREYKPIRMPEVSAAPDFVHVTERRVVGVDVFVEWDGTAEELGHLPRRQPTGSRVRLKMVSSRGTRVYPPTGADDRRGRPVALPVRARRTAAG